MRIFVSLTNECMPQKKMAITFLRDLHASANYLVLDHPKTSRTQPMYQSKARKIIYNSIEPFHVIYFICNIFKTEQVFLYTFSQCSLSVCCNRTEVVKQHLSGLWLDIFDHMIIDNGHVTYFTIVIDQFSRRSLIRLALSCDQFLGFNYLSKG